MKERGSLFRTTDQHSGFAIKHSVYTQFKNTKKNFDLDNKPNERKHN